MASQEPFSSGISPYTGSDLAFFYLARDRHLNLQAKLRLLQHFVNADLIFSCPEQAILRQLMIDERKFNNLSRDFKTAKYHSEWEDAKARGIRFLSLANPYYPHRLREIYDPPIGLFYLGELSERDRNAIAIVGTRRASSYGVSVAERLSDDLARMGLTVVSGLANGIDQAAHRASLRAGGRTLSIIGSGLLDIYPRGADKLCHRIRESGAVLSEFGPHVPPRRSQFPQRNRIISGVSLGVVIIEAPAKSGALITARYALEQGREVFAVPGKITSRNSEGCHRLILDGAKLVRNVGDIVDEIENLIETRYLQQSETTGAPIKQPGSLQEQQLLNAISNDPLHFDDLQSQLNWDRGTISKTLLRLELAGFITQLPGKYYRLRKIRLP